ncbi:24525_t:CDS:2 [Racocetra persica]|uniref:24525_t:CDS:1 n=1 Tax=Racocetra persica TaxID=160502 RepID=A0ACA9MF87_9GLOM|nr:24525_t:CDS:2 [Racocetra persica]
MSIQQNTRIPCHCLLYACNSNLVSQYTKAQHELEDMIQQEEEEESESFTEQLGRLNLNLTDEDLTDKSSNKEFEELNNKLNDKLVKQFNNELGENQLKKS